MARRNFFSTKLGNNQTHTHADCRCRFHTCTGETKPRVIDGDEVILCDYDYGEVRWCSDLLYRKQTPYLWERRRMKC